METPRPSKICKALLAALEASEGRRGKRKRDQTPDTIGLAIKRQLLERAVEEDPDPAAFEGWLLNYALHASPGAVSAMARTVFEEWRLVQTMTEFKDWLEQGAPSDDADTESPAQPRREERED